MPTKARRPVIASSCRSFATCPGWKPESNTSQAARWRTPLGLQGRGKKINDGFPKWRPGQNYAVLLGVATPMLTGRTCPGSGESPRTSAEPVRYFSSADARRNCARCCASPLTWTRSRCQQTRRQEVLRRWFQDSLLELPQKMEQQRCRGALDSDAACTLDCCN